MKLKICIITGSRAEYGLLFPLLKAIEKSTNFILQIVATGMHLSPEFGLTYREIEKDGFKIDEKVEMLLSSDTDVGIAKSTGLGMIGFADTFNRLKPDLVVVLGDRFEIFAAVTSAYFAKIPIAHLHGGELTEGSIDEGLRHAITKMAYWHFASTESYKNRVIQLGENPERVFNVGAIGIDNIKQIEICSKKWLEDDLTLNLNVPFLLITYHPVTLDNNSAEEQFNELLKALSQFSNLQFIFTKPNADANGRIIIKLIDDFVKENPEKSSAFTSLGQKRYLSLMKYARVIVGNSSSGIIESPSLCVPTVNIGDRQKGREYAKSVINAQVDEQSITKAIQEALSPSFQTFCQSVQNVYGDGQTTKRIMEILTIKGIPQNIKKTFFDLK